MVINFSSTLFALSGEPLKPPQGVGNGETLTLKDASIEALLSPFEGQTGDQKFKAFKLAEKISKSPEVEVTVEEVSQIKDAIGKCWSAAVLGAAWTILESNG